MAFEPFTERQYVRLLEASTQNQGGYFNSPTNFDLAQIVVPLFIRGTTAGNEQIRCNIFSSNTTTTPLFSSDWFAVSDIGAYVGNWFGNIFFNFNKKPINKDINYYYKFQTQNYTRNGDSFYFGLAMDWQSEIYTALDSTTRAVRISLLGYR